MKSEGSLEEAFGEDVQVKWTAFNAGRFLLTDEAGINAGYFRFEESPHFYRINLPDSSSDGMWKWFKERGNRS